MTLPANCNRWLRRLLTLKFALALMAIPLHAGALPTGSIVGGKTVAEWTGEWWKWGFSFPAATNPLLDTAGVLGPLGNVGGPVFFANASGGGVVNFAIDVPEGQYLIFPLLGIVQEFHPGDTEESVGLLLAELAAGITGIFATLDGVPIADLGSHFEISPLFEFLVPPDGLLDAGTYQALSTGYWLMLEPLSRGSHTLSFGGALPEFDFFAETNFTITVTPEPGSLAMFLAGAAGFGVLGAIRRRRQSQA